MARAQGRPDQGGRQSGTSADLGAVPQLFNKPVTYARFLASELSGILTGPLVIAMPSGFGVYVKEKEDKIPGSSASSRTCPFTRGRWTS